MTIELLCARNDIIRHYFVPENGIVSVGVGYKYVGGQRTDTVGIIVGVKKKLPLEEVPPTQRIPRDVHGVLTDVIEVGEVKALALTARKRPCKAGYSVGHFNITAGTLGAWVKRGSSELWHILSNNHVIANSNDAAINDPIYQPGPYDGGKAGDTIARLTEYVKINFSGGSPPKKKKKAMWLWRLAKAIPNAIARAVGCPYRLVVAKPLEVTQPNPNLVDAAVAGVLDPTYVDPTVEFIGPIVGIRDLKLGDKVRKVGRTTELTQGFVEAVNVRVSVSYGSAGTAVFDDQYIIMGGRFSDGGDSGSVIVTEDMYAGGLLFAGSATATIANRMSHVVSFLGVRL